MKDGRYTVAVVVLSFGFHGTLLAADKGELDVRYTSEWTGDAATLQTGPNARHTMRSHELTAIAGTSFVGATNALCHQTEDEETSAAGGTDYDGYCTWRDADGDLIFETYNGYAPPNGGPVEFGSGLIVGGTGKFAGITGGLAWEYGEQGRKRGLYYLPGE